MLCRKCGETMITINGSNYEFIFKCPKCRLIQTFDKSDFKFRSDSPVKRYFHKQENREFVKYKKNKGVIENDD